MKFCADPSPLSVSAIQSALGLCSLGRDMHIHDEVLSTNTMALALVDSGANHGTIVLAEQQTAGRGRWGRSWFSPPKKNLYCSVILKEVYPKDRLSWIPLITGLAITQAIEELANLRPSLKWPNDILVGDRKLGGVLCESTPQGTRRRAIVVGFGINVNSRIEEFPEDLHLSSTTLAAETGRLYDRNHLAARILSNLEVHYERLRSQSLQEVRAPYLASCSTIGRQICIRLVNGEDIKGLALDIGRDGALRVAPSIEFPHAKKSGKEVMEIRSGEVVHVR